ncbi:RNA recognition motif containing protein [Aphelenchoides avenae]|nr:RNA recognition motif containing protein [Aphelenchus avenae]
MVHLFPNQSTGDEPSTSGSAKFVPPQLRTMHPIAQYVRHAPAENSAVIESGPTLYKDAKKANEKAEERSAQPEMKTMALPSDVELLAAKRQSVKAFENSYLSKVLKGEKKMKRFVRTGGGQVWEDPSLADWDPNDFRIFCGDLGNEVSDELLAKAFRKYPSFQKAKVVRDNRTNKSKGYGFVSFKHQDDFIRAMREMDGKYVGNRPIKLRKSNWKDRNQDVVRKKQKMKEKLGLIEKHEVI